MNPDVRIVPRVWWVLWCFCVLALWSSTAFGQLVSGRLITSVSGWKQYDTVGVSNKFWRGYQAVLLDVAQGDFSLHGSFQGAVMLKKKLDELPDYRLSYGYAQWERIANVADLSLGRVPYFAGVGSGTVDGALTRFRFFDNKLRMTFYGGANVPLNLTVKEWGPLKRNFAAGGQIVVSAADDFRFGLSYLNRQRPRPGYWTIRPDSLFNPTSLYIEEMLAKEQYLGADLAYWSLDGKVSFRARYDHNLNTKDVQRAQLGLRYYPTSCWILTADYIQRRPWMPFRSFFSVFNVQNSEEIEGGADYTFTSQARGFVRGAFVKYVDDRSFRYTVGVASDYGSLSYRGSTGYAGELNAVSLQGSYPLLERMLVPNLGVTYSSYKLNSDAERENTLAAAFGFIVRPLQMASLDLQGQWLTNRIYKSDFRVFAALNIWFSEQLNLFE